MARGDVGQADGQGGDGDDGVTCRRIEPYPSDRCWDRGCVV